MKNKKKMIMNAISTVSIGTMVASYLPQLWLTYSTQDVSGQSWTFWALLTTSLLLITIMQVDLLRESEVKKYGAVTFQLINLFLALAMLVAVTVFG